MMSRKSKLSTRKIKIPLYPKQFIGAFVPKQLAEQVALWALLHQESKSSIIEGALNIRKSREQSVSAVAKLLVERAVQEWKNRALMNKYKSGWILSGAKKAYETELRQDLTRSGITTCTADLIITSFLETTADDQAK